MPPVDTDLTVSPSNFGGGGQSSFMSNPLGALSTITGIRGQQIQQQNALIEQGILGQDLQLKQKQMNARAKLGSILSSSPSIDEGINKALQDPDVAPYVTQEFGQVREGLLANQQYQNEVQSAATTGFANVMKGLASSAGDPDRFNSAVSAGLKLLSPNARARAEDATKSMISSFTTNLPTAKSMPGASPQEVQAARQKTFQARVVGNAATLGLGPEAIQSIFGTPAQINVQSGIQPGVVAPAQGGQTGAAPGSFSPSGPQVPFGLAPQATPTEGGGRLEYPAVQAGQVGAPTPQVQGAPGAGPPAPSPGPLATSDGKPLVADLNSYRSTKFDRAGQPILTGPNAIGAAERMKDFEGEKGITAFEQAQTGLARAKEIDTALDNLAKGGGWQVPGFAGQARNTLSSFANTFAQVTGQKLPFDPNKVASWEQFNKDTFTVGTALLTQALGVQREAASTIQSVMKAVPSIENTYLGGKLVNTSMTKLFQRAIDERNAVDQIRKVNGGDIQGAIEGFNKEHPIEDLAQGVLDQFGLKKGEKGVEFKDLDSLKNAIRQGLITPEEARTAAKAQFNYVPKPAGGG